MLSHTWNSHNSHDEWKVFLPLSDFGLVWYRGNCRSVSNVLEEQFWQTFLGLPLLVSLQATPKAKYERQSGPLKTSNCCSASAMHDSKESRFETYSGGSSLYLGATFSIGIMNNGRLPLKNVVRNHERKTWTFLAASSRWAFGMDLQEFQATQVGGLM